MLPLAAFWIGNSNLSQTATPWNYRPFLWILQSSCCKIRYNSSGKISETQVVNSVASMNAAFMPTPFYPTL